VPTAREAQGISERRACSIVGVDRGTIRYRRWRADDAGVRLRLQELALERRRFG
jgi:putative transposase